MGFVFRHVLLEELSGDHNQLCTRHWGVGNGFFFFFFFFPARGTGEIYPATTYPKGVGEAPAWRNWALGDEGRSVHEGVVAERQSVHMHGQILIEIVDHVQNHLLTFVQCQARTCTCKMGLYIKRRPFVISRVTVCRLPAVHGCVCRKRRNNNGRN